MGLWNDDTPAPRLRHHCLPSSRQAGCKLGPYEDTPLRLGPPKALNERSEVSLCEIQDFIAFSIEHCLDQVNAEALRLLEVNRGRE